ncbi:MAG: 6-phosphogluconolactonase [Halioglobus sp.]
MAGIVGNKVDLGKLDVLNLLGKREPATPSVLIQEDAGFHLGISPDSQQAGRHAAMEIKKSYDRWCDGGGPPPGSAYKTQYFTVAVGGGNTVKAVYKALLELYTHKIQWLRHVRFFLLEESSGEGSRESAQKSLKENLVLPLARALVDRERFAKLAERLDLSPGADADKAVEKICEEMIHGFQFAAVRKALRNDDKAGAGRLAAREARRYQELLVEKLGNGLSFHLIVSGIGKDGGIGAYSPYDASLKVTDAGVAVLKRKSGAIRIALNRGILTSAETVHLIIAGSLKLRALGRFEMQDMGDFERSVLETPIRMLRQTHKLAARVYIFADDRALHFDEEEYKYRAEGREFITRAETRAGLEEGGIHILLLHGFMGLYTFVNLLIRLPSAWTVSALHRGRDAKKMPEPDIFPLYAANLRSAILKHWKKGSPTPVGYHSIAGVICDHLMLGVAGFEGEIPAFDSLNKRDQQLVEALRCGGLICLAAWAPSDVIHIGENTSNLRAQKKSGVAVDYSGPSGYYDRQEDGKLALADFDEVSIRKNVRIISRVLRLPGVEGVINAVNLGVRYILDNVDVHKRSADGEMPYALRLMGARMMKRVPFFGLFKETAASLHDPREYQLRHIRALDAIIEYDIPYLAIIHEDDFMVSASRHGEEYEYLLSRRLEKDGVSDKRKLKVPVELVLARREAPDGPTPQDPLNPHLMLMSTSRDGEALSRLVTSAITSFVNRNVQSATKKKKTKSLASVRKWVREHA